MRFAALSLVSLSACLAACSLPSATDEPVDYRPEEAGTVDHALCLLGFTAIPLRATAGTGHHLVEVRLNGHPGLFVLDTGANVSVIEDDHAEAFGLAGGASRRPAISLSGPVAARQVQVDGFELGEVTIRQNRIAIADLGQLVQVLGPLAGSTVHGLIGQDVLNEHRAVIDMDRPLLHLIEEDRDPAPVPAERCAAVEGQGEGEEGEAKVRPKESA
jgi:hypothetical protein